jgi:hypothetical protein
MQNIIRVLSVSSLLALGATGCSSMNHTQRSSLAGSAVGTTAGAIIGHQSGHGPAGAAIGAVAGGVTGALVGNARDERDAAILRAEYAEGVLDSQPEMTNDDLIRMRRGGLSDDAIITAVRSRGGRFDLSPDALITLKQSGVSNRVIREIQSGGASGSETTYLAGGSSRSAHIVVVPRLVTSYRVRPAVRRPVVVRPRRGVRVVRRR